MLTAGAQSSLAGYKKAKHTFTLTSVINSKTIEEYAIIFIDRPHRHCRHAVPPQTLRIGGNRRFRWRGPFKIVWPSRKVVSRVKSARARVCRNGGRLQDGTICTIENCN